MEMFLDHDDHSRFLFDRVAEKPQHIIISSFGLYAGFSWSGQDTTQWGKKFQLATRDLMEAMRGLPDVRFLIGVANYKSCKGKLDCIDCEKQYCRALLRLMNHAEQFPEFKWRVTTSLHLKCILFFYKKNVRGVAGGRNFTDSDWADCTFELTTSQIKTLYGHVNNQWSQARPLTDETISQIFDEEEISPSGFRATLGGIQDSFSLDLIQKDSDAPF